MESEQKRRSKTAYRLACRLVGLWLIRSSGRHGGVFKAMFIRFIACVAVLNILPGSGAFDKGMITLKAQTADQESHSRF